MELLTCSAMQILSIMEILNRGNGGTGFDSEPKGSK
jgi:hypothetical protein